VARFSRSQSTKLAFAIGSLIVGLSASSVVLGASAKPGGGTVAAVRTAYSTTFASTSSLSAVDMPGMSVSVTVPAGQHALLLITFSASSYCAIGASSGEASCFVRASLDGVPVSPGNVEFDSHTGAQDIYYYPAAHSIQFVAGHVGPGLHTVKMRFQIDHADDTFAVYERTLSVLRSAG
jgi:hypothetical protein